MQRFSLVCGTLFALVVPYLVVSATPSAVRAEDQANPTADSNVLRYLGERATRMAALLPAIPRDQAAWEARRKEVRGNLARLLGLPDREPMRAKILAAREDGDLVVEEVIYLWSERAYVSANVIRPRQPTGRLPALVVPPGWLGQLKEEYYQTFVYHMASQGYVLLFIDDPHVGQRSAPCAGLYATASVAGTQVMGVQVFDTLRGLDYLLTRADVDPGRIGVAGLCQGSEQTWLAAALDERFRIAVPVCGTTTYEDWARMPSETGVHLSDPSPYVAGVLRSTDWHEIAACIAPRPVYIASNSGDNWWPVGGYDKVVATLEKTYGLYAQREAFRHLRDLRSHSMTPFIPELAPWIEERLKTLPASAEACTPCLEPVAPDLSMLRHMQRRIRRRTDALPASFADQNAWENCRRTVVAWLGQACDARGLALGEPRRESRQTTEGVVTEVVMVPQDQGLGVPVVLLYRETVGKVRKPAIILSHDSEQCADEQGLRAFANALVRDGYLVAIPEHATPNARGRRHVGNISSLYGVSDTVGLPPLAMRVWDDLAAIRAIQGRPEVSDTGPAMVGLGIGGIDAAIAAALDQRIAALGVVGAITVRDWSEHVAPNVNQFDRIMPYLPELTARSDWPWVYCAAAPRPLLLVDGTDRANWPEAAYAKVRNTAAQVYGLGGNRRRLTAVPANSPWGVEEVRAWLRATIPATASIGSAALGGEPSQSERVPIFSAEEVAAYQSKGASRCFRQLCYDYNWPGRRLADLPEKFTQADPVALAEFSRRTNLDAVLLLAVPHHGYCTYETKVGEKFPGIRGDWYGQCVRELHKRDIAALGYITMGTNWKYMRDNLGKPFIHGRMDADGVIEPMDAICFNAPGYLELVEAYTREVLTQYPVDALRYDMLFSHKRCLCEGCRNLYQERYGEELTTWDGKDERRVMDFYLATLDRAATRLTQTARATKPSVEIWQNHINTYSEADVNLGRQYDLAYIEFGDPVRLLALRGILNKDAIIVGQTLTSPVRRTVMALGARCYQYMPVNPRTALPDDRRWFETDLAPFFKMVRQVQPYLEDARPVSHAAIVYCEATRFRFANYDRTPYMKACEGITAAYLKRSPPPDFVNVLDLASRDLSRYALLVLPLTSGLEPGQLDALRRYARAGGNLLVAGDALRHDAQGRALADFALAAEMGLRFERAVVEDVEAGRWRWRNTRIGGGRATIEAAAAGRHTLSLWQRESGPRLDRLLLTRDAEFLPSDKQLAADRGGDRVLVEAEDYSRTIARGGAAWRKEAGDQAFSGSGYLRSAGETPFMAASGFENQSPELQYEVRLPRAGTWYLWIREKSDNPSSDSVHYGLDGKVIGAVNFDQEYRLPHPEDAAGGNGTLRITGDWNGGRVPDALALKSRVETRAVQGDSCLTFEQNGQRHPLLHLNTLGSGRIAWLASLDSVELTTLVMDWLAGPPPLTVVPEDKQVILTRQRKQHRWVLHLLSDGDYTVNIRREFAAPGGIAARYPAEGWSADLESAGTGVAIRVRGESKDRLLVLQDGSGEARKENP